MSASPVQTVCPNGSRATSHVMPKNTLLATAEAMSQRWYVRCGSVKTGKARCEHMFSALPLRADIAQCSRHVRFVPHLDMRLGKLISLSKRHFEMPKNIKPCSAGIGAKRYEGD